MNKWNYHSINSFDWNTSSSISLTDQLKILKEHYPIGKIFNSRLMILESSDEPGDFRAISKEEADRAQDRKFGIVTISDFILYKKNGYEMYILTVTDTKHNITTNMHPSLLYPNVSINRELLIDKILQ